MNRRRLSIVVPSFNGRKLLAKNLPRLLRIFPKNEIIVVDDGSQDKTSEFLEKRFPKVKVLKNKTNLGFASAANKGIVTAKSSLVLLLNNDCCPQKNFTSIILPYFKDPKTFAVGCLEKKTSQKVAIATKCEARGRGIGGFKKGLLFHQPGKLNKNNTLWVFGASSIYKKSIFKKLGGFDESFNPFYWEDFDLSYRALKSGYKIYFEKKAVVYHQESSTIRKYYSSFTIQQISFRNQLLTCWGNITDKNLIIKHFLWLPYHLIWTSFKTKGVFLLGFIRALIKLPRVFIKRKRNKFIYSDKEVLKPFQKEI